MRHKRAFGPLCSLSSSTHQSLTREESVDMNIYLHISFQSSLGPTDLTAV
ncbi:unnamed protein product [Ectocarpus sp. CCAP 1310/34]|nr:unnamed protein product [Ectocarpus sp. CCAP 1310/34]